MQCAFKSYNNRYFFVLQKTYQLSLLSAGSTIELVDAICTGKIQNGMAIIRSVIKVLCCE